MIKWTALPWFFGSLTLLVGACGNKADDTHPCKTGSEACQCYDNATCDDGLSCFAKLCLNLHGGAAGAGSGLGGAGESGGSEEAGAPGVGGDGTQNGGATSNGGSAAGNAGSSGSSNTSGGGVSLGGSGSSGSSGSGSGGSGSEPLFPPNPAG
ncbi:MAG TPA: hypothetical protein VEQ59_20580, partial [Polyangiaceae bacterium]|nr:hypothetical protein [Polyangiaceae bacterium]